VFYDRQKECGVPVFPGRQIDHFLPTKQKPVEMPHQLIWSKEPLNK
jgi:hypothetical protein